MRQRERVYAAINHMKVDRVPISFAGNHVTSIMECRPDGLACSRLYEYLGFKDALPVGVADYFDHVNIHDERVIQRLHSDMVYVAPKPPVIFEPDGTRTVPYLFGMRIRKTGYFDQPFGWPMRYMTTKKDIDNYPWPDPNSINIMDGVIARARYLHEETDYFVSGSTLINMFPYIYAYLTGMDKWLIDMKIRPKFYHQLAEKLLEVTKAFNDQFYGAIGQYVDAATIYNDMGIQDGPMMSHDDYVEFYKPYQAEIIRHIRNHLRPEAKIVCHSDGSIRYAIPDLIEIGVDALCSLQPLARDMEPWRLKRDFGDEIAFIGGFDVQQLLPLGSIDQVREGVKKLIQEYAAGGGYIFAAAQALSPDDMPENIVAMFDAAYEYGKYPIPEQTGLSYVDFIKGLNLG